MCVCVFIHLQLASHFGDEAVEGKDEDHRGDARQCGRAQTLSPGETERAKGEEVQTGLCVCWPPDVSLCRGEISKAS